MRYLLLLIIPFLINNKGVIAQTRAQDSTTLLSFFSKTGGDQWTNKSSWKIGGIQNWYGIKLKNNLVNAILLANNKLKGNILISDIPDHSLSKIDLSNNQLTSFPSGLMVDTLWLSNNKLTFTHLLPYTYLGNKLTYIGQDSVEQNITLYGQQRNEMTLSVLSDLGVSGLKFQWFKNGQLLSGANTSDLKLTCLTKASEGSYVCKITHDDLPNLALFRKSIFLVVNEDIVNAGADDHVCKSNYTLKCCATHNRLCKLVC
jgi:hypothetical protein